MSGRSLTAAMLAAIQAGTVRPVLFYQGQFSGGTLRLWSGLGSITWNSLSWTGAGELLGVSPVQESGDLSALNFTVSLTGSLSSILSVALGEMKAATGFPGKVWLGAFDSGGSLLADPFLCFSGRLDDGGIVDGADVCTISVAYESRLIDLERPRIRRYTDEDQKRDYAADQGFGLVTALQDAQIPWGRG